MPTVKIDINTGIEYSPTDGIDSAVKLHNFTVGRDGSLYKLPALKNLKTVNDKSIWNRRTLRTIWFYRLLDIKKFQTSAIEEEISVPSPFKPTNYRFREMNMFRRFIYLTTGSYGVINIDYDGKRIENKDLTSKQERFGEFEYDVFNYVPDAGEKTLFDFSSLSPKINVDFNAQYDDQGKPTKELRAVFPTQHMFESKQTSAYDLLMQPRNMVHCSMNATSNNPDIKPLSVFEKPDKKREKNDLARGTLLMGNRMFFYSALDNAIYVSEKNNFREMMQNPDDKTNPFKIVPPEEIQAITDFNGNIITFTPTGVERWLLSSDDTSIIQRGSHFSL